MKMAKAILMLFFVLCGASAYAADNTDQQIIINAAVGSGDGQIGYKSYNPDAWVEAEAITVDSKGNVYVADTLNARIVKFDNRGRFLFNIAITTPLKRTNEFATDITVDYNDNLYVLIKNAHIIYKYDQNGKIIETINYESSVFANKISISRDGVIYLHDTISNTLCKLNSSGRIDKTWANVDSYVNDDEGRLYVAKNKSRGEKYDKAGKPLGAVECETDNLKVIFPAAEGGGCYCPPQYIDKKGYRYFLKRIGQLQPKKVSSILIFDQVGQYKKTVVLPFSADIYPQSNIIKFGSDGNFYSETGYPQDGFQVTKITLDQ
jgi:hypothetical protein